MASIPAGLRAGEIVLDIGKKCAGNMAGIVKLPPQRKVLQRMAAIEDDERRVAEVLRYFGNRNERRVQALVKVDRRFRLTGVAERTLEQRLQFAALRHRAQDVGVSIKLSVNEDFW